MYMPDTEVYIDITQICRAYSQCTCTEYYVCIICY